MSFPRVCIEAPGFLSECRSVASLLQNSTHGKRTHEKIKQVEEKVDDSINKLSNEIRILSANNITEETINTVN